VGKTCLNENITNLQHSFKLFYHLIYISKTIESLEKNTL